MTLGPALVIPYVLVLTRLSGIMFTAPGFASTSITPRVKLFLTLSLSLVLTPILVKNFQAENGYRDLPILLAIELLVGLAIGFSFFWSMAGVAAAGEKAGLQMGLGVASTIDPASGSNALYTQVLFTLLFMALFMTMDGHHAILLAFHESYQVIPAGTTGLRMDSPQHLIEQTGSVIIIGFRLAAGILIPLMITTFSMALVSRAFPQANVFILSFGVSLMLGLTLFAFIAPAIRNAVAQGIEQGVRNTSEWLTQWGSK